MTDRTNSVSLRADRTRNHLSDLMDDLQDQITPAELVNQLVGQRSNRGPGIAQTIAAQVSKNPLACMLIVAGVGWLMLSDRIERNPRAKRKKHAANRAARSAKQRLARHKRAA